jgi:hypothetical protein
MNSLDELKNYIGKTVYFNNGKNPTGMFEIHSASMLITIDANGENVTQVRLSNKNGDSFSIRNCKIVLPLNLKDARYEIYERTI